MGPEDLPDPHDAPQSAASDVVFAGGEPTLDPSLQSLARSAVANGARRVLVQTNGRRLAYPGYLGELVAAGVTHFDVSLHGPTPAIHDFHTQVQGSFLQTAKGLQNAVRERCTVGVTTVVTRSNFRHLPAIVDLLRRIGVRSWHVSTARPLGGARDDASAVVPRLGMIEASLDVALRRAVESRIDVVTSGIPPCIAPEVSRAVLDSGAPVEPRPAPCQLCLLASKCSGPPPGYSAAFAESDLRPFTDLVEATRAGNVTQHRAWFAGIGATGP